MLFALSSTRCYVPAQESQDIAIAVKCTEFYEVVSHPLKVNCLCISYQMKRALQNGKIRIDFLCWMKLFSPCTHLKELVSTAAKCGKSLFCNLAKQLFGVHLGIGGHFVYFAFLVYFP